MQRKITSTFICGYQKVLVIFLCIAIGHVVGELDGRDSAKENLRVKEDVLKEVSSSASIDDNKTSATNVESLRENFEESSIFHKIAIEMAISKNPLSIIETSTRPTKQSSSKTIKDNSETMYLRKRPRNFNVLQKVIKNSKESERGWNDFLNSVVRYSEALHGHKRTDLAIDDIRLRRRKRQVDDPADRIMSYRAYNSIRRKLPLPMRLKIRETQLAEDYLLDYWVGAGTTDEWRLKEYNRTRFEELEEFKKLVEGAGDGRQQLIDSYKAIRKGTPWNFDKLRENYVKFFAQPSPALTEYLAMKYKEYSWIDCFLNGTDVNQLAAAGPKYYALAEEELERRVRAEEAETVLVEVVVDGGSVESVVAMTDDVRVEATNTATTAPPAQAKKSSSLVRIAVLFALVTQVIIVILILGPEIRKLCEWCKRMNTKDDDFTAAVEKEPLYRKKTFQLVTYYGKSRSLLSSTS